MSYFKKRLSQSLENPEFKQEWEANEVEHQIARSIIKKRKQLGLTQMELATLLHTTQSVVSRIENADQNLTIGTLKDIAKVLEMDLQTMMFPATDLESETGLLP